MMIELPVLDAADSEKEKTGVVTATSGQRQWRSLGELEGDADLSRLSAKEFLPGASEPPSGASRRQFMQLMGASVALAGLTGCRKPYEKILPYSRKPEDVIEGISRHYATGMPFRGSLSGLLVESHEGRPTKVEGNPEHPVSRGSSGVFEQASVLDLYDPDRSQNVLHNGSESSWADFRSVIEDLPASTRLAVLVEENASPTIAAQRARIAARFPQMTWAAYSAYGENTEEAGYQTVFGQDVRPVHRFSQARVVVSLDGDFLAATARNFVHNTREFAEGRRVEGGSDPLRLYAFEPSYSTTGGMADHRSRVKPSQIGAVAARIASQLGVAGAPTVLMGGSDELARKVDAAAADLRSAGSAGLVVAGDAQPASVHALCAAINDAIGAVGSTVSLLDASSADAASNAAVEAVVADVKAGNVDALVMIGANPAYDLAGDTDFVAALASVTTSVHVGLHVDETAANASWHVPQAHYLESWGDGRAYDGTLSVVQPLIAPLYTKNASQRSKCSVSLAGDGATTGYDQVLRTWQSVLPGSVARVVAPRPARWSACRAVDTPKSTRHARLLHSRQCRPPATSSKFKSDWIRVFSTGRLRTTHGCRRRPSPLQRLSGTASP